MKMDKSISTRNNIVIESIRNYVAFLISLRGLLLSFIEEKAPRTGGNIVARIAYGVMSGSLLLQIARDEFINLYVALSSGNGYISPGKVDFNIYIRHVCDVIDTYSGHNGEWDNYLQKLIKEDMCNRTAVAYSIPYDASTRRCYGNETFVWLLSKLSPKFVSMFLSDTYYKKMGFSDFFKRNGNSSDIEKVIDDSCLRTGFTVFVDKMKQELEMMEKRNQDASLSDLYSFVSSVGESVSRAVDDLKVKNNAEAEQLKDMVNDIGLKINNLNSKDKAEETRDMFPTDAWKKGSFYQACKSIGAIFKVNGVDDYMGIVSIDKFAKGIIEYLEKDTDKEADKAIKLALCSIPSNEELSRRLWSFKKGTYMQLKVASFNQKMSYARLKVSDYKKELKEEEEQKEQKESKPEKTPEENRIGEWKYGKKGNE